MYLIQYQYRYQFVMLQKCLSRISKRFVVAESSRAVKLLSLSEQEEYLKKIESNAFLDYKIYPALPHQDPSSPEYIASELDEYHDKVQVDSYNTIISQFKHDLKLQKEVWESISNLDRPYKRGIPGIETNLDPNGPRDLQVQDLGFERYQEENINYMYPNEDAFIANTPYHVKHNYKHVFEWEKEKLNKPVNRNYNHGKGYKYDVPVAEEDKYQFVADRLGHPEFLGTPLDRLFQLQNDIFHPVYLDQPFVKMPSTKPSETLNFEQGEVLYENTRVVEWLKFWQVSTVFYGGFFAAFVPYNLMFKTNLVTDAADELLPLPYHLMTLAGLDHFRAGLPIACGAAFYGVYILNNLVNTAVGAYATKVTFSKDKELVFVKTVDVNGFVVEDVYEMAHLEILPPKQRSAVVNLSSQDEDGLWRVSCLNSDRSFLLYNDKKHWNQHMRDQFFASALKLWDHEYYGLNRPEQEEADIKWSEQADRNFSQERLPQ